MINSDSFFFKLVSGKYSDYWLVALGTVLLSSVAIINRGPVFFDDTGTYLLTAIDMTENGWLSVPWSRSPFYSFFLYLFHQKLTLWPIVFAQSAIISHLIYLMLRTTNNFNLYKYLLTVIVLVFLTPVPWFTAQLTPDVFTSVAILGMILLSFFYQRLSTLETAYLFCLTSFAIISHFSHLPLSLGIVTALVLFFL